MKLLDNHWASLFMITQMFPAHFQFRQKAKLKVTGNIQMD